MAITVSSAAESGDLTTISRVRAEIGNSTEDIDDLLEHMVHEASDTIVKFTGREFKKETLVETLPGFGRPRLLLTRTPIVSISQISFNGSTVSSTLYVIEDADAGVVFKETGWFNTEQVGLVLTTRRVPGTAKRDYSVTYIGGYVLPSFSSTETRTLPYGLERATVETVKTWIKERSRDPTIKSEKIGDFWAATYQSATQSGLPKSVENMLKRWQRIDA